MTLCGLQLDLVGGPTSQQPPMSCYRTLDSAGIELADANIPHSIDQTLATKIYSTMASLQTIDTIFYEAQRQVMLRTKCCSRPCASTAYSKQGLLLLRVL